MAASTGSSSERMTKDAAAEIAALRIEVDRLGAAVSALQQQVQTASLRAVQPAGGCRSYRKDPPSEPMDEAQEEQRRQVRDAAIEFALGKNRPTISGPRLLLSTSRAHQHANTTDGSAESRVSFAYVPAGDYRRSDTVQIDTCHETGTHLQALLTAEPWLMMGHRPPSSIYPAILINHPRTMRRLEVGCQF